MNEDKASRYNRLKRRTSVLQLLVTAALLAGLLLSGGAMALGELAARMGSRNRILTIVSFGYLLYLVHALFAFPLHVYGLALERKYGRLSQSTAAWLRDYRRGLVIEGTLAVHAVLGVYLALAWWPRAWWILCALGSFAVTALFTGAAPLLFFRIFWRVTPLERASLRERVLALFERAGVPVLGVYEWALGEKVRHANAALVGIGPRCRILVSDVMLAEYSEDEIEVVLAHELAHHVHRDPLTVLATELALLVAGFGAAAFALQVSWRALGLQSPADVAGLPLLLLAFGGVRLAARPAVNALSRSHERRADRYALELTNRPAAFISAMRRVAALNLAEERPSRLVQWLFHTHPPCGERIAAARALPGSGFKVQGSGFWFKVQRTEEGGDKGDLGT